MSFREGVERRSAVVLVLLARLPRALRSIVVIGLVAAGLLAPPVVSGVVLLVMAAFLGWLAFLSWPRVPPPARAIRLLVITMLVGYALTQLG